MGWVEVEKMFSNNLFLSEQSELQVRSWATGPYSVVELQVRKVIKKMLFLLLILETLFIKN